MGFPREFESRHCQFFFFYNFLLIPLSQIFLGSRSYKIKHLNIYEAADRKYRYNPSCMD